SIWDPTYFTNVVYPIINKYKLGWILFWRNAWEPDKPNHYYLPYPGHSSESDFKQFVDQPLILTNKDVYQQ
ncbi:endoglucanase, partial [Bacteroides salyersiae]